MNQQDIVLIGLMALMAILFIAASVLQLQARIDRVKHPPKDDKK